VSAIGRPCWNYPGAEIALIVPGRNLAGTTTGLHFAPVEPRSASMTDLILAIAHHLTVFSLAGLLLAEVALLRPGLSPDRIRQLGAIDIAYGIVAALIVVVGVLRVTFGDKGADYYMHNWAFWLKMAAFVLVGLLSVPPTLAIIGWKRRLAADPAFSPDAPTISGLRRFYIGEIVAFACIPAFAAAMARGYGIF
jgi:putative membrane protein